MALVLSDQPANVSVGAGKVDWRTYVVTVVVHVWVEALILNYRCWRMGALRLVFVSWDVIVTAKLIFLVFVVSSRMLALKGMRFTRAVCVVCGHCGAVQDQKGRAMRRMEMLL